MRTIREHSARERDDWRVPAYGWLAKIVESNVYLGLRLGDVIHARWASVDFDQRTLAVRNTEEFTTKRGKERVLPIPAPALDVLKRRFEARGGSCFVFTSHRGRLKLHYLSQIFLKFRRMAGLPDGISFHSARHTYATWMAERGVPVGVIKELMGHSSITTTERYMKVRPATSRHWIEQAFARE